MANRKTFPNHRALILACAALLVLIAVSIPADAVSKRDVSEAKERVQRLEEEIADASKKLEILESRSEMLAGQIFEAEDALRETQAALEVTRAELSDAEEQLARLQERLNERAAEQYMYGPASALNMILGSQSFGELTDRMEYASAISEQTNDLAINVARERVELQRQQTRQRSLVRRQRRIVADLESRQDAIFDTLDQQESLIDEIRDKRADAMREARDLSKAYQEQLERAIAEQEHVHQPSGGTAPGSNPFAVCPVGTPRGYSDGFGAPRFGGGYHPHAGVDIIAPEGTPIYATFSGTVRDASNTLGGISVIVSGSEGWTYNAHLVSIARLGAVNAGEIIGYVGATGDTSTPHNHFEWHPTLTPSSWPESAYGYSVIGTAVNPYPLLIEVC